MKKERFFYVYAFLIPFLACLCICIGNGVYPFGENCILRVDMYHQYCPFFTEFLNKLQNKESLMYSWRLGLGSDFVALYAYYLASPLNWLLIICPKAYVIEFMTLTLWIKIGVAGLSFFCFLRYHSPFEMYEGKNPSRESLTAIVFSSAYALSGFVGAYSWNIMWMDVVALAPFVILGLERLVREKKPGMYFGTLALCVLSNYYMAMILCIFLVLYFGVLLLQQTQGRLWACVQFALYSLLGGGCGAVLLIPEMKILGYSGSSGISFPKEMSWYFDFWDEIARMCATAKIYNGDLHWPNIYAGSFSLLLLLLYFVNRKIAWKEKLPQLSLVVFFLLSFSNKALDFIWHGLHFPDSLPGRQSFLYIFVILVIAFSVVREWEAVKVWQIGLSLIICEAAVIASRFLSDSEVNEASSFWITALFLLSYALLMIVSKLISAETRPFLRELLFVFVLIEIVVNMSLTGFGTSSRTSYVAKVSDYETLLQQTKSQDEFYRVEDLQRKTKNDSAFYGYPSATQFSSLMNINVSHYMQNTYMEGGKNFYCYNGAIPLTSAMLSVKYVLFDSPLEEGPIRTLVASSGNQYLYENRYCLPFGYMMDEESALKYEESETKKTDRLNLLGFLLGASGQVISRVGADVKVEDGSTTITPSSPGYYYAAYVNCDADVLTLTQESGKKRTFSKTTHRYLLELGQCEAGDSFTITNTKEEAIEFYVYKLNPEALDEAYETLCSQTMTLSEMTETSVLGSITVLQPGRLILSIPNEEGWTLKVDGKDTEIVPFDQTFVSVYLEEGTHAIELNYETPGLRSGAAISLSCLGVFGIMMWIRRMRYGEKKNKHRSADV